MLHHTPSARTGLLALSALLAGLTGCAPAPGTVSSPSSQAVAAADDPAAGTAVHLASAAPDESVAAESVAAAAAPKTDPFEPNVQGASEDEDDVLFRGWVEQAYVEVMTALEGGADIRMREQVPVVVATNKGALDRRRAYSETLEENQGLTYGMDLFADLLLGGGILGRYFPDEKAFYLFSDNIVDADDDDVERTRAFAWAIMAHEMVHAYDDQVYDSVPTPDEAILEMSKPENIAHIGAMMALLEGRATYAAELACLHAGVETLPVRTMDDVADAQMMESDGSIEMDVGAGVANALARAKLAQYVYGRTFAKQAYDFGGEKFFGHVFDSLPITMQEMEDFEKFKARWADDMSAALDAEEEEAAAADAQ